ncbi:MAG: 7-carboxy-7-deazaguanine synthase [Acidimicrobiaceae bacterium]|jgi:7-carboxy-7-deazaguanine synthase (Cx14CxxC type)
MYLVKEAFFTLQGEGANTGRAAVFCRFAGCNLWSGREEHRASAVCRFCDTDFVGTDGDGGGRYATAGALADHLAARWGGDGDPFVVCTGGEPLLQLDVALVDALHERSCRIAVETNGTQVPPPGIDWICVSPKAGALPLALDHGDELKVVWPQAGIDLLALESLDFAHRFVQPMDGPDVDAATRACVDWCLEHPRWRLSLQTHKQLGIR